MRRPTTSPHILHPFPILNMSPKLSLFAAALVGITFLLPAQEATPAADGDYRDFKGSNGTVIQAVLIDRTDAGATLLLRNGKRSVVPLDKLSAEDQEYVKSWNKDKAVFLQKCRSLTIRQLLELRGYESFVFRFEGNSIFINGKVNGKEGKFLIDTGAGTSLLHIPFATKAECKIGEMTEKIYGVAGEAPAGYADVGTFSIGEAVLKDRQILSTDLANGLPAGQQPREDVILGADILSQLDAVISYPERRIFLRPDRSDESTVEDSENDENLAFRLIKTKDGKTFRGNIVSKTPTVITVAQQNGQKTQIPISRLSPEDAEYATNWSEASAFFLQHCQSLTIKELLELRRYQSFEYERRGNHIFVDGTLNDNKVTYMVDTGANNTCLHIEAAKKYGCEVSPTMDHFVYGIGGKAPAALTVIPKVTMGDVVLTNRKILSTDLNRDQPEDSMDHVGLFGADFMRELDAVITYRESRIFLIQKASPVTPGSAKEDAKK